METPLPAVVRCVLLSGTAGTGKSSLCRVGHHRMVAAWGRAAAAVDVDALYGMVDPLWELTYSDARNALVLEQAVGLVRSFARHGWRTVLVTGNSLHDPLDTAPVVAALAPTTTVHHVTLRVREEVLSARCVGAADRDVEAVLREARTAAARPPHPGTAVLDASDLDVVETLAALVTLVRSGAGVLGRPAAL